MASEISGIPYLKRAVAFELDTINPHTFLGYIQIGVINDKDPDYALRGISQMFLVFPEKEAISFLDEPIFFYGHIGSLGKNYGSIHNIPSKLNLNDYVEKETITDSSRPLTDPYFIIPIEEMELSEKRQENLANLLIELKKHMLPIDLRSLKKYELETQNKERVNAFWEDFEVVPEFITQMAYRNKGYYVLGSSQKGTENISINYSVEMQRTFTLGEIISLAK